MGVVTDCRSVVIRNATLEQKYPGGAEAFARNCPNSTFCTDGDLCRVSFMVFDDAICFIHTLAEHGIEQPNDGSSPDVAVVSQGPKFLFPCDWLEIGSVKYDGENTAEVAWLKGTELTKFAAPKNWKPSDIQMIDADFVAGCEYVERKEGVDVYKNKSTGELFYVGRTDDEAPPVHLCASVISARFSMLEAELIRIGAFEGCEATSAESHHMRRDLESIFARAERLVEDSFGKEPGPLHLQGIAARMLEKWENAEDLFRRVTVLRPDFSLGWLELTMALVMSEKFEDAEIAARKAVELDPGDSAALGNLGGVLFEQGKLVEANLVLKAALKIDPKDEKNRTNLGAVKQRLNQSLPWWKRLFS